MRDEGQLPSLGAADTGLYVTTDSLAALVRGGGGGDGGGGDDDSYLTLGVLASAAATEDSYLTVGFDGLLVNSEGAYLTVDDMNKMVQEAGYMGADVGYLTLVRRLLVYTTFYLRRCALRAF
jgi:hypothetical protein